MLDTYETSDIDKYILKRSKLTYNGHKIYLKRAPEPEDIIWKNLAYNFSSKARRLLLTWLVTLFILAICFGINILITIAIRDRREQAEENNEGMATVRGLAFISAMTIVLLNRVLATFITKFTKLEKHHTTTEYQISTAFKLAVAMFINSAIIPLFINADTDEVFSNGNIVYIYIYIYIYRWTSVVYSHELGNPQFLSASLRVLFTLSVILFIKEMENIFQRKSQPIDTNRS